MRGAEGVVLDNIFIDDPHRGQDHGGQDPVLSLPALQWNTSG